MTDAELEAALRRATKGSVTGALVVGGGTFAMGVLAALCGVFRWDPGMRHYRPGMWVAYGAMVLFFGGAGSLVVLSGLFWMPRRGREFVDRVMRRPETLTRVWLLLVKSKYNPADSPGQIGVGTSLCAQSSDGKHYQFVVKGADARALLAAVAARAPKAVVGPP